MKEELVTLSREKGFMSEGNLIVVYDEYYYLWMCELQKWLRDNHSLNVEVYATTVSTSNSTGYRWTYLVHGLINHFIFIQDESLLGFLKHEEALEDALIVALNSL